MADVFISYSHADRARVSEIADNLQEEGFTVWWDPELRTGQTYDARIEEELRDASCVVVAWSDNSVKSDWVRAEATAADEKRSLAPVALTAIRPPLPFNLRQTEDFTDWRGDRGAEPWRRLTLQARALAGLPDPGEVGETEAQAPSRPSGPSLAPLILLLLCALAALGVGAFSTPIWSLTIIILALLSIALFRAADSDLSPAMKAMARGWLLPRADGLKISAIEGFNNLFEAAFSNNHLSKRCVRNSFLASAIFMLTLAFSFDYIMFGSGVLERFSAISGWDIGGIIAVMIFCNGIGDYISLYQTRVILRHATKNPQRLYLYTIIDAFLTCVIYLLSILMIFVSIVWVAFALVSVIYIIVIALQSMLDPAGVEQTFNDYLEGMGGIWNSAVEGFLEIIPTDGSIVDENWEASFLLASVVTTFLTSIWLWLALLFTPLVRALVWSRSSGVTALGRAFDVRHKPFTTLGYLIAAVLLIIGGAGSIGMLGWESLAGQTAAVTPPASPPIR